MLLAMFLSTFYPAFRITRAETGSTGLAILAALCFLLVWVGIMVAAGRVFSAAWKQLARAAAHPLTFPALLLTGMLLRIAC